MKTLTDEQLNLELCKWLGWYKRDRGKNPTFQWCHPEYVSEHDPRPEMKGFYGLSVLPDHINDLSSLGRIALIEAKLTEEQAREYAFNLNTAHPSACLHQIDKEDDLWREAFLLITAKARLRATAILRTVKPEVFQ